MPTIDDLRADDGRIDARSIHSDRMGDGDETAYSFVTAAECQTIRTELADGRSINDLRRDGTIDRYRDTIHQHAVGNCDHSHIDAPPVAHHGPSGSGEWVVVDE